MKKALYILGITLLLMLSLPLSAAAQITWNDTSDSNDHYYVVTGKADWEIAPGIWESEIVLNTPAGNRRQVLHLMEIDTANPATRLTAGYAEMNPDKLQTATVSEQATWVENNWGWNVVGAMNTALSWYNTEPYISQPHRKYESLGFMMVNGVTMYDHSNGFPTCLVIHSEQNEAGEWLPMDIPRVELRNIYSEDYLNGFEQQVIPVSYDHFIVRDGIDITSWYNHSNDVAPRSVVGVRADGSVVLMMNDGRGYNNSAGMTMYECAEVMLAVGCVSAANCDGGGSSTFLSQRPGDSLRLHCVPSDWGFERENTNTIIVTALREDEIVIPPSRPSQTTTAGKETNGDGWFTIPSTGRKTTVQKDEGITTPSPSTENATVAGVVTSHTTKKAATTTTVKATASAPSTNRGTAAATTSSGVTTATAVNATASSAPSESGPSSQKADTAPSEQTDWLWIWSLVGVVLVVGVAAAIAVMVYRKVKK